MRTPLGLLVSACLLLTAGSHAGAASPATVGGDRLAGRGLVLPSGAPALPATAASSWLVADLDTGEVLASKDPHGRFAPASTLKTLTAETLIPRLNPHAQVVPSFDDVNVDGSKVGLVEHVKYPISQLFTAMLVVSGNDAANTLASANGGIAKTVADMNTEAERLQALDTHAVNANGLDDPSQLSSAYDLALIARAGMQIPAFRDYVRTKHSQIRGPGGRAIFISSHDKLLYNYDGAIGIKNGYTVRARATFVGAATRNGHTLVVTLMHTNPRYWPEAAALLDWGFKAKDSGIAAIGQLVDPVASDKGGSVAQSAPVRPSAAKLTIDQGSSRPLLPTAIIGGGVLVIAVSLLRSRRRGRSRLSLPKL